jgi:O-methyltransferase
MKLSFEERFTALQKAAAAVVFPLHVPFLEKLNANALVKRWMRQNPGLPVYEHRYLMYDALERDVIRDGPIDYIEFGVWKGETLRRWTGINRHPDSRFFGFDSFVGLPETWDGVRGAGAFDVGGQLPDIDDPRVTFVKGWFQDTLGDFLRTFEARSRLVIHHDSDLYSSVMYCLTMMNDVMVPGTILIFDEFSSPLHEFRALNDYTQSYRRRVRALGMTAQFAQQAAFVME